MTGGGFFQCFANDRRKHPDSRGNDPKVKIQNCPTIYPYPWMAFSCFSCSEWRRPFILRTLSSLASIFLARLSADSSSARISASSFRFFSERITSRRESSQILSEAADFLSVAAISSPCRFSHATLDSCRILQTDHSCTGQLQETSDNHTCLHIGRDIFNFSFDAVYLRLQWSRSLASFFSLRTSCRISKRRDEGK